MQSGKLHRKWLGFKINGWIDCQHKIEIHIPTTSLNESTSAKALTSIHLEKSYIVWEGKEANIIVDASMAPWYAYLDKFEALENQRAREHQTQSASPEIRRVWICIKGESNILFTKQTHPS